MDPFYSEWLNLLLRWFHVFAGILWIGSTWYFTWLDRTIHASPEGVWMVHSGGFYLVEKQTNPKVDPGKLHWFRFEALFTWLSGLMLLGIFIYWGWDSGVAVNEESEDSRNGPGRAAVVSTVILLLIYGVMIWLDSSSLTAGTTGTAEPSQRGATLAVHSSLGYFGGFMGPLAIGWILDLAGGNTSAGWTGAWPTRTCGPG